jgi:phosphatidylglycerophosphate synthase
VSAVARRALATRHAAWARRLARILAGTGVSPNAISVAGLGFGAAAAAAFFVAPRLGDRAVASLLLAAVGIQLRFLCNLLDGMVAVEEGRKTARGDLYNELPDRLADVVILVGAGYAIRDFAGGRELGWAAAVAAVLTAYVRALGGSLGLTQDFAGPMAKQHRMFTLTIAALLAALESALGMPARAIRVGLVLIAAGSIATAWRRTRRLAAEAGVR